MTPITTYREDIELAIKRLDESTVMGMARARSILENILALNPTKSDEDRQWDGEVTKHQQLMYGLDWCESRLQDHDGVLIEILDILIEQGKENARLAGLSKNCRMALEYRSEELKAKLVGEK
jgi:hypothetical protein